MPQTKRTLETYTGDEVAVEPIRQLSDGGTRVDVEADDGRTWRLDITHSDTEIVTMWNADGDLADIDEPEWLDDVVGQLQRA